MSKPNTDLKLKYTERMVSGIYAGMAEGGVVRAPPSPSKVRNPINMPKIEKARSSNTSALIRKFTIKHTQWNRLRKVFPGKEG